MRAWILLAALTAAGACDPAPPIGPGGVGPGGNGPGNGGGGCKPSCASRACGDDGCGGVCGGCQANELCSESGSARACAPIAGGAGLVVDATAGAHAIAPTIYGMSFAPASLQKELAVSVNRWGGNSTTRYHWQLDVHNAASDWYFENIPNNDGDPKYGSASYVSSADQFVLGNKDAGSASVITVPTIGWAPRDRVSNPKTCSYPVQMFGAQQAVDPYMPANSACGNGKYADGSDIPGADPTTTSIAVDTKFTGDWLAHLVTTFGAASKGGVAYYTLDNEMMLWDSTHRDVHPTPADYDEVWSKTTTYAPLIRAADKGAYILGFGTWGVLDVFYSRKDTAAKNTADRDAHGSLPLMQWYLTKLAADDAANKRWLVDCLDLHYYSQSNDPLHDMRSLYDSGFHDPSWIDQAIGEPVQLLPRLQQWITAHRPGTRVCFTEYNQFFGNEKNPDAAIAEAEMLGIFGKYGVRLATYWTDALDDKGNELPPVEGFRLMRNFDGAGGAFGDTSVAAASNFVETTVYAATDSTSKALTILVVNKAAATTRTLEVRNFTAAGGAADVFHFVSGMTAHVAPAGTVPVAGGMISLALPAKSATLLRLRPQ